LERRTKLLRQSIFEYACQRKPEEQHLAATEEKEDLNTNAISLNTSNPNFNV